jgi:hypothetical protein
MKNIFAGDKMIYARSVAGLLAGYAGPVNAVTIAKLSVRFGIPVSDVERELRATHPASRALAGPTREARMAAARRHVQEARLVNMGFSVEASTQICGRRR